jgi:signal peptide peptidase SppA
MEPTKYVHIARWMAETIWAILPGKFLAMQEALAFLAAGGEFSAEEIKAIVGAAPRSTVGQGQKGVAVLPLTGVISHRAGMLSEASGGTSTERFAATFRGLMADSGISAIVLDVNSPGGSVAGVEELANEIYAARKTKPIVAHVNAQAASAAYWIASSASEISVTPSGEVGSIGVFAAHQDRSGMYEQAGVKTTLISAGRYKTEGNPYEPLSEEARAAAQKQVNAYYGMFTRAVARGRGVPVATVREGFGEGRMVLARDALGMGMVDHIETIDETLRRLQDSGSGKVANVAANTEEPIRANMEEPARRITELDRLRLEMARLR